MNFVIKNLYIFQSTLGIVNQKLHQLQQLTTESTNRPLTSNEARVTVNNNNEIITCVNQDFDPHEKEKRDHEFRCYCGRSFNLLRGLNTHWRTCFVGE